MEITSVPSGANGSAQTFRSDALKGRKVVVTGAARGIGRAAAIALARPARTSPASISAPPSILVQA